MKKLLILFILIFGLASCSQYQKALKSDDAAFKNKVAEEMYTAEKYKKAIRLYEAIAPGMRGKPTAERMFYFYSKSLYAEGQYLAAGYQFESFASSYPKSEKREEAAFLGAECYYKLSPVYSLDQVDTDKALEKLQAFIDTYPNSEYLPKANECVKELRYKLEEKAYEIAKQYYTTSDYRYQYSVAIKALDNFVADYPGTPFKESALFYKLSAAYKYANHSIPNKKEERFQSAKSMYNSFVKNYPEGEFRKQADDIASNIDQQLQRLSNTN